MPERTEPLSAGVETSPAPVVHIVEDDRDLREGLDYLLKSIGLARCTYADPQSFLKQLPHTRAGCIVLDVRLPEMSGIDLIKIIRAENISLPIIVMTAHADVPVTIQAFKLGAIEFLLKPFSSQEFLDAINKALDLDRQQRLQAGQSNQLKLRFKRFNSKDWDLVELLRQGFPNKRIAVELGVTERAVEMRRSTLLRKVNVTTLPELIELVTKYFLLPS